MCYIYFTFYILHIPGALPTTPPMPSQGPGECPSSEWIHYGGVCFLFRPDEYKDWSRANYECKEAGGDALASIRTAAENWFVHNELQRISAAPVERPAWIGLMQTNESGIMKVMSLDKNVFQNLLKCGFFAQI